MSAKTKFAFNDCKYWAIIYFRRFSGNFPGLLGSLSTHVCENVYIKSKVFSIFCHFWITSSSIESLPINFHYFTSTWWDHSFSKRDCLCLLKKAVNHSDCCCQKVCYNNSIWQNYNWVIVPNYFHRVWNSNCFLCQIRVIAS